MRRLKYLALSTALALSMAAPARAQSLDEMKAIILQLQKRVEQLEAAQRHGQGEHPAPSAHAAATPRAATAAARAAAQRAAPATRATAQTEAQMQAAQQAAEQAQEAAAQAQASAAQAQQQAAQAKETAAAEVKAAFAPPPGRPGGSFRIPGTETVVRIYGFAKVNGISDLTTTDRSDSLNAQAIPLFGTAAQRQGGGDTQFSARRSRFDVETWTPVNAAFGEFHSLMEMDFAGQNTSLTTQSTSNSYTPRLRKFYFDFGKPTGGWGALLFGQESSVYSDTALLPIQWMADWTFAGLDNIRQAQVRYTYGFGKGVTAAFAVESPYSDVTTATGTSYPDSNGGGGFGWQQSPDFTGRLVWKQDWGLLALRGVARPQIGLNNEGATSVSARFNKTTAGYGVGPTAVLNLFERKLVLMASGNFGSGLGRYLDNTSNGFGAVSNAGLPGVAGNQASLEAVDVYGGMVGLQYFFTPTIRTNMALGGARMNLPGYVSQFGGCVGAALATGTCSATNSALWSGTINIVWSPFRAVDLGFEYQHVERHLQSAFSTGPGTATTGGIQNRLQVTAIGRF